MPSTAEELKFFCTQLQQEQISHAIAVSRYICVDMRCACIIGMIKSTYFLIKLPVTSK